MAGALTLKRWIQLLLISLPTISATPSRSPQHGVSIQTSSGLIVGHAARYRSSVSEYLGIPYAFPPVGKLRFAPPVEYYSNHTIQAHSYVSCIQ